MVAKNGQILDDAISGKSPDKKIAYEKASEINSLISEYEKAFESFLYKQNSETVSM